MMYLSDIRDLIKQIYPSCNHYYVGKLDSKYDCSIGIYSMRGMEYQIPIGGLENKKNEVIKTSILIHWNRNSVDTEKASYDLFKALLGYKNNNIYTKMLVDYPVDVGTDNRGVYERVIEVEWHYLNV